jgi:hypothetical protein
MDNIENLLDELLLPSNLSGLNLVDKLSTLRNDPTALIISAPGGNWARYQVLHGGIINSSAVEKKTNDPFMQFLNDVVIPTFNSLKDGLVKDITDVKVLLQKKPFTLEDVRNLIKDLIHTYIGPMKKLILGIFDFVKDLIGDVRDLFTKPLDIPFLSAFYAYITKVLGEKEELTLVNSLSLLVAVPFTYLYKELIKSPPYSEKAYLQLPSLKKFVADYKLTGTQYWYNTLGQNAHWDKNISGPHTAGLFNAAGTDSFQMATAKEHTEPNHSDTELAKTIYSTLGGGFASIAALLATGMDVIKTLVEIQAEGNGNNNSVEMTEITNVQASDANNLLPKNGQAGLAVVDKLICGGYIVRDFLSFPIASTKEVPKAAQLRKGAWYLGLFADIANIEANLMGSAEASLALGGLSSLLVGVFSFAADIIDHVETTEVTWASDIISNGAGYYFNVSTLIYKKVPETSFITLPILNIAAFSLVTVCAIGLGGSTYAAVHFKEGETQTLVRVGG